MASTKRGSSSSPPNSLGQVLAEVRWSVLDLFDDRRPAVDEKDDVLEVAAAEMVAVAATFERLELGSQQIWRCDSADPGARRKLSLFRVRDC